MAEPITPTPINPAKAEDRTWRLELFTDYRSAYPIVAHRERNQMDADGNLVIPSERGDIAPTTTDGGKPPSVSFTAPDIMGAVGQGKTVSVGASPYGPAIEFPLSKITEIIVAALETVATDNKTNRRLLAQLRAEEITPEEYATAVADLVQTTPLE